MLEYRSLCYLLLLYNLKANAEVTSHTAIACETEDLRIECAPDHKLTIIGANYGRTSKTICDDGVSLINLACYSTNSLKIVMNSCQDKISCIVPATNTVFGNPCNLTVKYLEVQYKCVITENMNTLELEITSTATSVFNEFMDTKIFYSNEEEDLALHTHDKGPPQVYEQPLGASQPLHNCSRRHYFGRPYHNRHRYGPHHRGHRHHHGPHHRGHRHFHGAPPLNGPTRHRGNRHYLGRPHRRHHTNSENTDLSSKS